ncbi:hypothetical protein BV20DRAFT_968348 [Pilatotrama ljubarskyi]|nr:hypothetical protein BV20DRAFT_968348 [Pilatotrama ljubarskyi]
MAPQIDEDTQAFIQATVQTLVERFPTSSPRPKVKEPDTFDGTKARYDAWKQELQLYVGSMDKDRAITTIVSFIRGDHIERWRRVFCKKHHLPGGKWTFESLDDFWTEVDKTYVDPNVVKTAQANLEQCLMGSRPAADFFQEFEELANLAGYSTADKHLIDLVERHSKPSIINTIYASGEEPTSYEDWKTRITNIDTFWRKGQIVRGHAPSLLAFPSSSRPAPSAPSPSMRNPAPVASTSTAPPIPTRRDGTGIVYGGHGQSMDLDRTCQKCGSKRSEAGSCRSPWHYPNRSPEQQRVRRAWEEPEAREELVESMRRWAAEDPEDFAAQGFELGSV